MKKLLLATTILAFANTAHAGFLDDSSQKAGPQAEDIQKVLSGDAGALYNLNEKERAKIKPKTAPVEIPAVKAEEPVKVAPKKETKATAAPVAAEPAKDKPVIKIFRPEDFAPKAEAPVEIKSNQEPAVTPPTIAPSEEPAKTEEKSDAKRYIKMPEFIDVALNDISPAAGDEQEPEIKDPVEPPTDNPYNIDYENKSITNYQDPYLQNGRAYKNNEDGQAAPAPKANGVVVETPPTFKEERPKMKTSTKDFLN